MRICSSFFSGSHCLALLSPINEVLRGGANGADPKWGDATNTHILFFIRWKVVQVCYVFIIFEIDVHYMGNLHYTYLYIIFLYGCLYGSTIFDWQNTFFLVSGGGRFVYQILLSSFQYSIECALCARCIMWHWNLNKFYIHQSLYSIQ